MSPAARTMVTALLLLLGVQFWLVVGHGTLERLPRPIVWVAIVVLALLPPVNRRIAKAFERVAHPLPRTRLIATVGIALVAGAYLYFTASRQHRDFHLKIHDEHSYAIQARMLASGRLWMPAHPAAESFDSPYVIVRPVYASMYFPGTALALVPGVWLGLPWWATPLVLCAAAAGVLYRVVTELIDGVAGLLAVLLLVSLSVYRELSLRLYSQTPILLLTLCLVWAWLAWRRDPRAWRALVIGIIAGWMLIVRPLDATVCLLPVAVAAALDLRRLDRRQVVRALAALAAGALPFVALQLIANRGITGSWLTTPHGFYARRDFPGVTLGFHEPRDVSTLATIAPQKRELYEQTIPAIKQHRPNRVWRELIRTRLPSTADVTLPNRLLLVLLPIGIAALFSARRRRERLWVVAAPLPLFVLAYALYLFYFSHYLLVTAPATIFLIVLAARELPELWPRAINAVAVLVTFAIVALALYALPEIQRTVYDDVGRDDLAAVNKLLADLPQRPALVLFRRADGISIHREPVYNLDTRDIDDAEVIRAHDLPGEATRRLIEYYAAHQPRRHVYRVIRSADGAPPQVIDLGPVGTLRHAPQ